MAACTVLTFLYDDKRHYVNPIPYGKQQFLDTMAAALKNPHTFLNITPTLFVRATEIRSFEIIEEYAE